VLQVPGTGGTLESIEKQVALSLEMRDAINTAVVAINKVEVLRSELNGLRSTLKKKSDLKEVERLDDLATDIASKLYDIHLTGAREDAFRSPMKLYGRLSALASDLSASGIDFAPTDQQGEVYTILEERLIIAKDALEELVANEVQSFNQKLNEMDMKIDLEQNSDGED
ncbi:MAG: glycosyl hydrolase, partial [Ekhidna sp.]|nr:glycosyl hydrolase [Ekhidna sp.]